MSLEMYQANIMDHYKHPRNFGEMQGAQEKSHVTNPLCGDELDFFFLFDENDVVKDIKFSGRGCTIALASASMLTEKIKGLPRSEIEKLQNEDVIQLLGVPINPARMKCATLSLEAVQQAVGHH
jgi:nitrogen fixation NifU-like protein